MSRGTTPKLGARLYRIAGALILVLGGTISQSLAENAFLTTLCSRESPIGFERRLNQPGQFTAKFTSAENIQESDLKKEFAFLIILSKLVFKQFYQSEAKRCLVSYQVDPSFALHFEFGSGSSIDKCAADRCAHTLAKLFVKTRMGEEEFRTSVQSVVKVLRALEKADLRNPILSVDRASIEVFRSIYPTKSRAKIFVDLTERDFIDISFQEYEIWSIRQQTALNSYRGNNSQPNKPIAESVGRDNEAVNCHQDTQFVVREVEINHHGWGHSSIILVNHGFSGSGLSGIKNTLLRQICPPNNRLPADLQNGQARSMREELSCYRRSIGDDRWLVLFSKREPVQSVDRMRRYSEEIRRAAKSELCLHPKTEIIVAKFLPPS